MDRIGFELGGFDKSALAFVASFEDDDDEEEAVCREACVELLVGSVARLRVMRGASSRSGNSQEEKVGAAAAAAEAGAAGWVANVRFVSVLWLLFVLVGCSGRHEWRAADRRAADVMAFIMVHN